MSGICFATPLLRAAAPRRACHPCHTSLHHRARRRRCASMCAHTPVLLDEVAAHLRPALSSPSSVVLDCTLGAGGHAARLLTTSDIGIARYIGLDKDATALSLSRGVLRAHAQVEYVLADYSDTAAIPCAPDSVDAILLDAGVSSMQLDDAARGFSFSRDGPLDMRMDNSSNLTADTVLNEYAEQSLASLIRAYGEESAGLSARIAAALVAARPIRGTAHAAGVVGGVKGWRKKGVHPATQTFQAVRIHVNGELDALSKALPALVNLLKPDGRLAVISFHSLEDRLVKAALKDAEERDGGVARVNRRVIEAGEEEVKRNPRARSAKLRVARRVAPGQVGKKVGSNKYARPS